MSELNNSYSEKLFQDVAKTIATYDMLQKEDAVLIGVSGGPDSVALLHILRALASRFSLRLGVAHLNHCLRQDESDNDAKFVATLAKAVDLPCFVHKENVINYRKENRLSLEEAARRVRYTFFSNVAKKHDYNKIALGHHREDNAELVLMNLFRGSGPRGLSGIPPVRNKQIIRPLIHSQRSDIINFLKENRFDYIADKSNMETRYLRNKIRHHLIPELKAAYNPNIIATLNRLTVIINSEEEWIESEVDRLFNKIVVNREDHSIVLSISKLEKTHPAQQRRILRKAIHLAKGDLRRISLTHIDAIARLLTGRSSKGSLDLPDAVRVQKSEDSLIITKEKVGLRHLDPKDYRPEKISFDYIIEKPTRVFIKEIDTHMVFSEMPYEHMPDFQLAGQYTAFVDKNRLHFPLTVRNCRSGDRFRPLGMNGTQKVKKYFIDKKVPLAERYRCPVLVSKGKIIWLGGHRIDESVKLTSSTRKVMKIELFLA